MRTTNWQWCWNDWIVVRWEIVNEEAKKVETNDIKEDLSNKKD